MTAHPELKDLLAESAQKLGVSVEEFLKLATKKSKNTLYKPEEVGKTNQKVMTPPEFIAAAVRVFTAGWGFALDWASSQANVCDWWFGEDDDSLTLPWADIMDGQDNPAWLNPPFKYSEEFLKKCFEEAKIGARTLALVQCAAGCSYWHKDNLVWGNPYCRIIFLEGRINFIGYGNGAKQDCVLIDWSPEYVNLQPHERVLTWDWRNPEAVPVLAWPAPCV